MRSASASNSPGVTATLESYATLMGYGKYNGINLDIGYFTAAGYDAIAFIKEHHDRITNLHPNETGPLESYAKALSFGKYNFVNADIGYFTAAGYDAIAFIKEHHDRITNLHLKVRT